MENNIVAIVSAISAVGIILTAVFQYFSSNKKTKSDTDVGYGKAILDSHTAVWGEVHSLRIEIRDSREDLQAERLQNAELIEQLRKALNKIDEVIDEKREMVLQMVILNDRMKELEKENRILQDKVDKLSSELEKARNEIA